jgi:hypothetical protein
MKKYYFRKSEIMAGMQVRKQQRTLEFHVNMWNLSVTKNWEWKQTIFDFLNDMNNSSICFLQVGNEYQVINLESEIIGYITEVI